MKMDQPSFVELHETPRVFTCSTEHCPFVDHAGVCLDKPVFSLARQVIYLIAHYAPFPYSLFRVLPARVDRTGDSSYLCCHLELSNE